MSMYFLIKIVFRFSSKEKISYFREKIPAFQILQKRFFWKNHLFRTFEESIIFPFIFLRNIIFHSPSKE